MKTDTLSTAIKLTATDRTVKHYGCTFIGCSVNDCDIPATQTTFSKTGTSRACETHRNMSGLAMGLGVYAVANHKTILIDNPASLKAVR